jgi:hypothetical protein
MHQPKAVRPDSPAPAVRVCVRKDLGNDAGNLAPDVNLIGWFQIARRGDGRDDVSTFDRHGLVFSIIMTFRTGKHDRCEDNQAAQPCDYQSLATSGPGFEELIDFDGIRGAVRHRILL